MNKRANQAYGGIPTFCRTKYVSSLDELTSDIAVLGIPFDEGVSFRPGTRFGPRSIREYSMRFRNFDPSSDEQGYWDMEDKKIYLTRASIVDCGDVDIVQLNLPYVYKQIDESIKTILRKGTFPVILGGDHSISFPVVRAFEDTGALGIVHLDAHLDRRESTLIKYGHGSPIRRIGELEFVETIVSIGLRGPRTSQSDYLEAEHRGEVLIPNHTIKQIGIKGTIEKIPPMQRCFVSIDIDVLDPSLAPGTGTPEADGLNYCQVKSILRGVASKSKVVGFDIVEVNPYLDPSGRTSYFASELVVEFLGAIFG